MKPVFHAHEFLNSKDTNNPANLKTKGEDSDDCPALRFDHADKRKTKLFLQCPDTQKRKSSAGKRPAELFYMEHRCLSLCCRIIDGADSS